MNDVCSGSVTCDRKLQRMSRSCGKGRRLCSTDLPPPLRLWIIADPLHVLLKLTSLAEIPHVCDENVLMRCAVWTEWQNGMMDRVVWREHERAMAADGESGYSPKMFARRSALSTEGQTSRWT